MLRQAALLFALASFGTTATASRAQDAAPAPPPPPQTDAAMQSQGAPVERPAPPPPQTGTAAPEQDASEHTYNTFIPKVKIGQEIAPTQGTASAEPGVGIYLRVGDHSAVRAVALTEDKTQLKVERGIANISVHDSVDHAQIMIDLPRGEVTIVKDGFYTFNADTDTVRVIKGEAYAYPEKASNPKPIKVKEDHAVSFNGATSKPFEFHPYEARADLIPYAPGADGGGTSGYQPGPYGYGYGYAAPYGYGPYGYGDPFFYGYPFGWGLGLGFYGGWGWGGYGGWGRYGGWDRDDWGGRRGGWAGRGGGFRGGGGRGGFGGGHAGGGGGHAGGGGGHR